MKTKALVCVFSCLFFFSQAQNKTYYLNSLGNDANDGLSTSTAWQSLSKINNLDLEPGDKILLAGGESFEGSIQLNADDQGTAANPITISSYGNGKATVYAINANGLFAQNCRGIEISDLIIKGNGSDYNGIYFLITQTSADIDHIRINRVDVQSFGSRGCLIGAENTDKGFNDVLVSHSSFHDNGAAGMESYGAGPSFSHTQFSIRYCKFYNNSGTFVTTANTGNGLVISGVDGGVVEFCEAYNNGANNRNAGGGPVGIWTYDTKNMVIQFCESHHNKAGLSKDGGGFDIDGGSQNCTIQYCYSHDNEGPGYALVEYGSPNEFTGNIIRYNVSQNDARKNSYGALLLYGEDAIHPVKNSQIYNNTLYVDAENLVNGNPSAINILSGNFSNVQISNTILYVTNGVNLINSSYAANTNELHFFNNNYYSTASNYEIKWAGTNYTSVAAWKTGAPGQEMRNGNSTEVVGNPILMAAGSGNAVHPADSGSFHSLFCYSLNDVSPVINKGAQLSNMGSRDFYGNNNPQLGSYDIGATEYVNFVFLPVVLTSFSALPSPGSVALRWNVAQEELVKSYEIQKSDNGVGFTTIGSVEAFNAGHYLFYDKQNNGDVYYRLQFVYADGKREFSQVIRILKTPVQRAQVYFPGRGMQVQIENQTDENGSIIIYDASGRRVHSSKHLLVKGTTNIFIEEAIKWKPDVYFVQITGRKTNVTVKCSTYQ